MHVAIELFEQALKAVEHGIKRWLVAGEIAPHKAFENAGIAIFRTPEFDDLVQAGADARFLGFTVFGQQFALQFQHGFVHLLGSQSLGGFLRCGGRRGLGHRRLRGKCQGEGNGNDQDDAWGELAELLAARSAGALFVR